MIEWMRAQDRNRSRTGMSALLYISHAERPLNMNRYIMYGHSIESHIRFRGVVGYHTSLTHWWSPVRARAKSFIFLTSHKILSFVHPKRHLPHELS